MIQAAPKPKPADDEEFPAYDNFNKMVQIGETNYRGDMGVESQRYKKKW